MNTELKEYADRVTRIHKEALDLVTGLPVEALNWTPLAKDTNSLAALTAHMCGAESTWIQQALTGQPVPRDKEGELKTRASSADGVKRMIERAEAGSLRALEATDPATLDQMVEVAPGRQYTKRFCIAQSFSHFSNHLGHMQLTRQLWENRRGA